tara:strand:- start:357 stop:542 length:186 start_codon:yes stop_codon:yes gene_type:complete
MRRTKFGHIVKRREPLYRWRKMRRKGRFNSSFERDLFAMAEVWRLLKEGTIRAIGEIGRQY